MRLASYKFFIGLSRLLGSWVFDLFSAGIAAGYFLFFPLRVKACMPVYRALFPDRPFWVYPWYVWRQYCSFTLVYKERFLLPQTGRISFSSEGMAFLERAVQKGRGAILLMSHMGNWEIAAHLLKEKLKSTDLLLYMGKKEKEAIEGLQKKALEDSGIRIVATESDGQMPFDVVEGIRFLQSGGVISMTGDRLWKTGQRSVGVTFLGHRVHLPAFPHVLAMLSGAPLLVFFSQRTAAGRYHFAFREPIAIPRVGRRDRDAAVVDSAQKYADAMEEALRRHPFQWYHFSAFLGPPAKRNDAPSRTGFALRTFL